VYRLGPRRRWILSLATGSIGGIVVLSDDRTVLAADSLGSIDVSRDAGMRWTRHRVLDGGVYSITSVPGNPSNLLAGGDGGIYRSVNSGKTWRKTVQLPHGYAGAFAWQPGTCCTVFAATSLAGERGVLVSRNSGISWRPFARGLSDGGSVMSITVANGWVFAGTMGVGVWSSRVALAHWRSVSEGLPQTDMHISGFSEDPRNPRVMAAAGVGRGMFFTVNGGRLWKHVGSVSATPPDAGFAIASSYSPSDGHLYVGTADGVYELGSLRSGAIAPPRTKVASRTGR